MGTKRKISNLYGRIQSRLRISLKFVPVRLESAKPVNVHVPMLQVYPCVDVVEVVSELYITVAFIQQLVLLIYCSVINNKNVSIFSSNPVGIYLLKVNNTNTRTRCQICSKLTIKTQERCKWRLSGVFIDNFEHISHLGLLFLLLTLNM